MLDIRNPAAKLFYNVKDYGAVGDAVNDDTTGIQNAINAAQTALGGIVFFPAGRYRITATINITGQGITMMGVSAAYTTDVGNYALAGGSWIVWNGAASGIAVKASAVVGAGNQALIGFRWNGLSIDCRNSDANQATIGLQVLSAHGFHIEDFFIIDSITAALDFNVVATLGEARDCTRGKISRGCIRILDGAAGGSIAIRMDGDTLANTCCNTIDTIQISHLGTSGNAAIEMLNSDSNEFHQILINRASGTNVGIRLNGSASAATLVARNNVFYNCSPGAGGMTSATNTFPALDNYNIQQQVGNGEPVPTIGASSSLYFSCNGTQNGGAFSTLLGNIPSVALNVNFTTTIATNTNTLLSFNALPGEVWLIEFSGNAQCSSTGGVKYQITAPAASTVEGALISTLAAVTALSTQRISAINTLTATATHTVATTPAPDRIVATVTVGATGGAIAIGCASTTATQTTTIFAGASFKAQKVNKV